MAEYKRFDEFYDTVQQQRGKWSLLFGNGLPLSCPDMSNSFKFDYRLIVKELIPRVLSLNCPGRPEIKEPEFLLENVRVYTLLEIMNSYLISYQRDGFKSEYTCFDFLNFFSNLLTINYDPLTYIQIVKTVEGQKNSIEELFIDGFKFSDIQCSKRKPKTKERYLCLNQSLDDINIFFLHGAYHIFAHILEESGEEGYLIKISKETSVDKNSFKNNVIEKWNEFENNLENYFRDTKSVKYPDIIQTVIMEDRNSIKKHLINKSRYLTEGLNRLKNAKKIFTFGCSFTYDAHLLDAIFSGEGKTIALGHYGNEEKERFQRYIEKRNKKEHHTVWLIETKGHENHVWQKSGIM